MCATSAEVVAVQNAYLEEARAEAGVRTGDGDEAETEAGGRVGAALADAERPDDSGSDGESEGSSADEDAFLGRNTNRERAAACEGGEVAVAAGRALAERVLARVRAEAGAVAGAEEGAAAEAVVEASASTASGARDGVPAAATVSEAADADGPEERKGSDAAGGAGDDMGDVAGAEFAAAVQAGLPAARVVSRSTQDLTPPTLGVDTETLAAWAAAPAGGSATKGGDADVRGWHHHLGDTEVVLAAGLAAADPLDALLARVPEGVTMMTGTAVPGHEDVAAHGGVAPELAAGAAHVAEGGLGVTVDAAAPAERR